MKRTLTTQLLSTLQRGAEQLSDEAVSSIVCFVQSQQDAMGAFLNRSGKPDIYYTLFGWSLCLVLGIKIDAGNSNAYLKSINPDELDLVHYTAYVQCKVLRKLLLGERLGAVVTALTLRNKSKELTDFTSVPHNDIHAPYSQYIGLTMKEAMGSHIKERKEVILQLECYRVIGGGYKNDIDATAATLNATVAALAVQGVLAEGNLKGLKNNEDIAFLLGMQHDSGGFPATKMSPVPDLLSTATALFMLHCYNEIPIYPQQAFIEAHWLEEGGFSATLLDEVSDVEYTFYGLLALGAATE